MSDQKRLDQITARYRRVKDSKFEIVKIQNDEPYDCLPYYDHFLYRGDQPIAKFSTWALRSEEEFLANALADIEFLLLELQIAQSRIRELEQRVLVAPMAFDPSGLLED